MVAGALLALLGIAGASPGAAQRTVEPAEAITTQPVRGLLDRPALLEFPEVQAEAPAAAPVAAAPQVVGGRSAGSGTPASGSGSADVTISNGTNGGDTNSGGASTNNTANANVGNSHDFGGQP